MPSGRESKSLSPAPPPKPVLQETLAALKSPKSRAEIVASPENERIFAEIVSMLENRSDEETIEAAEALGDLTSTEQGRAALLRCNIESFPSLLSSILLSANEKLSANATSIVENLLQSSSWTLQLFTDVNFSSVLQSVSVLIESASRAILPRRFFSLASSVSALFLSGATERFSAEEQISALKSLCILANSENGFSLFSSLSQHGELLEVLEKQYAKSRNDELATVAVTAIQVLRSRAPPSRKSVDRLSGGGEPPKSDRLSTGSMDSHSQDAPAPTHAARLSQSTITTAPTIGPTNLESTSPAKGVGAVGIGIGFRRSTVGYLVADLPRDGSGAKSGLVRIGDVLLEINGVPITMGTTTRTLQQLVLGDEGTYAELTLCRNVEGQEEIFTVKLQRFDSHKAAPQSTEELARTKLSLIEAQQTIAALEEKLATQTLTQPKIRQSTDSKPVEEGGVGIFFQEDGLNLKVGSFVANGPADRSGNIKVGDILRAVNGENMLGKPTSALRKYILGPVGTIVKLSLLRMIGGAAMPVEVDLVRAVAAQPKSSASTTNIHTGHSSLQGSSSIKSKIGSPEIGAATQQIRELQEKEEKYKLKIRDLETQLKSKSDTAKSSEFDALRKAQLRASEAEEQAAEYGSRLAKLEAEYQRQSEVVETFQRNAATEGTQQQSGIGIIFKVHERHQVTYVGSMDEGGPAQRSGQIEVGDVIIEVDGDSVAQMELTELRRRILGAKGTAVTLGLARKSAATGTVHTFQVTLIRSTDESAILARAATDDVIKARLESDNRQLRDQIEKLVASSAGNAAAQEQLLALREEAATKQKTNLQNLERANDQVKSLRGELDLARNQIRDREAEIISLSRKLRDSEIDATAGLERSKEAQRLQKEVASLTEQLAQVRINLANAEKKVGQAKDELAVVKDKETKSSSEQARNLARLKTDLEKTLEDNARLQDKLKEKAALDTRVRSLTEQNERLREDVERAVQQRKGDQQRNSQLEDDLRSAGEQLLASKRESDSVRRAMLHKISQDVASVGLLFDERGKDIVVSKIIDGGSADKSGQVRTGDRLLAIEGQNVNGDLLHVYDVLLGREGSNVELKLLRDGSGIFNVNLTRGSRGYLDSRGDSAKLNAELARARDDAAKFREEGKKMKALLATSQVALSDLEADLDAKDHEISILNQKIERQGDLVQTRPDDRDARRDEQQALQLVQRYSAGDLVGVGITLHTTADGSQIVSRVVDGSSAARNAVRVGDRLLEVEGSSITGRSLGHILGLLTGPEGTNVRCLFGREGGTMPMLLTRGTPEYLDSAGGDRRRDAPSSFDDRRRLPETHIPERRDRLVFPDDVAPVDPRRSFPAGEMQQQSVGVGLFFNRNRNNQVLVHGIVEGTSAERCKMIQAGDLVVRVNDKLVDGLSPDSLQQIVFGPPGTTVVISFARHGQIFDVELIRGNKEYFEPSSRNYSPPEPPRSNFASFDRGQASRDSGRTFGRYDTQTLGPGPSTGYKPSSSLQAPMSMHGLPATRVTSPRRTYHA